MPATTLHPKVAGGAMSGAVSLIVLYALGFAIAIPAEVAAAVGVIATTIGGYLSPWMASHQPK